MSRTEPNVRRLSLSKGESLMALAILVLAVLAAGFATPNLWSVREVGTTYFTFRTITDHPTGPVTYLILVVYMLAVALVGERLVWSRLGEWREVSWPVRWLAGMVPGYVLVSAFNRGVTLVAPHSVAPALIVATLVVVVAGVIWRSAGSRVRPPAESSGGWAGWLGVGATTLAVAILLLQRREMHIVGDAFTFFDRILRGARFGIESAGRLPVVAQHYDELSVLYPMLYGPLRIFGGDSLACAWVLYTFFMAGAMCLVYACARRLGLRPVESATVTAVLFLGTFSLRPSENTFLVFDSGNPLAYCLHPGRILGAVMPVLFAALILAPSERQPRSRSATIALSAFVACGIATTTFTNTLVLVALAGFALIDELCGGHARIGRAGARWTALLAILLLAYPFVGYLDRRTLHYLAPYLLLAIIGLLVALLAGVLRPITALWPPDTRRRAVIAAWLPRLGGGALGLAVGLLGFGNLLIGKTAALSGGPHRLWGLRVLTRPVETALSTSIREMFGPYEGAGPLISHLDGPFDFLARFGLLFLLAAGAVVVLRRSARQADGHDGPTPEDVRLFALLAFYLLAFMAALFAYDFLVGHVRDQLAHWVRSRLLEPWFYGVFFLGLVGMRRYWPRTGGTIVFALLCTWLLASLVIYPGLAVRQWVVNLDFFVRQILGWGG